MESIQAFSAQEDIIGPLQDYVVSQEQSADEEHPMHAKRTITVIQTTLRDAIVGISGSTENTWLLWSPQRHNEVQKADNRLLGTLQALVNKTVDEELSSVQLKDPLLRKVVEAIPSRRQIEKMTDTMLDS